MITVSQKTKSPSLAQTRLDEINRAAKKIGLFTDLNLKEIKTDNDVEDIKHYIKEISGKQAPF